MDPESTSSSMIRGGGSRMRVSCRNRGRSRAGRGGIALEEGVVFRWIWGRFRRVAVVVTLIVIVLVVVILVRWSCGSQRRGKGWRGKLCRRRRGWGMKEEGMGMRVGTVAETRARTKITTTATAVVAFEMRSGRGVRPAAREGGEKGRRCRTLPLLLLLRRRLRRPAVS